MAATRYKGSAWRLAGAPLILLISLIGLYGQVSERANRNDVLAHGTQTQALVLRSTGIDSVEVQWIDADGHRLAAISLVGKPFARQNAGRSVEIKYLPNATIAPVILSEADERDRINSWWIKSDIGTAGVFALICLVIGLVLILDRK